MPIFGQVPDGRALTCFDNKNAREAPERLSKLTRFASPLLRDYGIHGGGRALRTTSEFMGSVFWSVKQLFSSDLVREIVQTLSPTEPEWRVAVADEAGKPLYRFRVIGEAIKQAAPPGSKMEARLAAAFMLGRRRGPPDPVAD